MRQHHLFFGHLSNALFDRGARHEPIDHHFVLLTDAVRPTKRLDVVVRIPVRVVYDDCVRSGQIDAEAAGARRQQKTKLWRARRIKSVDGLLTVAAGDRAVQPLVLVAHVLQKVFEYVEHLGHLGKYEDAVAARLQLEQHFFQQLQFAARLHQRTALVQKAVGERRLVLGRLQQVRMVAALFQLHHYVQQRLIAALS
ncbi:hypothetical protein BpHYR1_050426 [Brachionus plicatilis]|uniref:Uncharacterized protein n=1 Tax=Brachionus plicatilis TaxID=10195 RepID=A0A3M7T007_BRAPC|nr:hypothetical protein BpHYR1_050426 [Brachionus plicatilis]